jgi:hypothetical protein
MKVILVCADAKSRFLQMLNPKTWVYQKAKLYPETIEFIHAILDNEELWELTFDRPLCVKHNLLYSKGSRLHDYYMQYWLFQNRLYVIKDSYLYSPDECELLVRDEFDKNRRKFERLKSKFDNTEGERVSRREKIIESVRIEVWRRDEGQCARCGSKERLEYDHIVPVSKGGSNTARNIELLCERCNREKSDRIQ